MHIFGEIRLECGGVAGDVFPRHIEVVVAVVETLGVGGMTAPRLHHHRVDDHAGNQGPIRIGANHRLIDQLLDYHHHSLAGKGRFLLYSKEAPDLRIPGGVGTLGGDDRDVGVERGHRRQYLSGVGTDDGADQRIGDRQVGAHVVAHGPERQPRGAGGESRDHAEVTVLLDLERWCALLHRAAEGVQRSGAGISRPGEDELLRAAGGDHLIVDQVRCQTAEGKVPAPLANDFMSGGKVDEMRETLDHHGVTVPDMGGDGVLHGDDFGSHEAGCLYMDATLPYGRHRG